MSCGGKCPDVVVVGSIAFADPSADVGLAPVNGVAATAMRSDSAPALDQGISPTWTGLHDFLLAIVLNGGPTIQEGTGSPNGAPSGFAPIGSLWLRDDAPDIDHLLYGKTTAVGLNTGWTPFSTGGGGGTTINPTDNFLPIRTNATTFGDSPLHEPFPGLLQCTDGFFIAGNVATGPFVTVPLVSVGMGTSGSYVSVRGTRYNFCVENGQPTITGLPDERLIATGGPALPTNSYYANHGYILRAAGTFAANGNNKQIKILLSSMPAGTDVTLFDSGALPVNGGAWEVEVQVTIVQTDVKKQVVKSRFIGPNATPIEQLTVSNFTTDNTTATGLAFEVVVAGTAAAGDLRAWSLEMEWIPF